MKIVVDFDKCIAAGQCVLAADDLFGQNEDDGIVIVLSEKVPPERLEAAQDAARRCPTGAIVIIED
jgi:ferredoxin